MTARNLEKMVAIAAASAVEAIDNFYDDSATPDEIAKAWCVNVAAFLGRGNPWPGETKHMVAAHARAYPGCAFDLESEEINELAADHWREWREDAA